ncbi:glycosyltransferase [Ensifer sp. ENS11]|uniref:glycosyltransferase n=1 Tax=Ensifer sp. ENS11 TaxID=2769291 RepID=UPI00177FFDF5|nr:glycosyltransferase [Ensifer sp. ENS11]MBD9491400.1 glycosyltransferase [Ensifer sp. ENS11]
MFGWLFDSKHPTRSVVFELFINGAYRGQWSCAYFRPDLLDGGLGNGVHGFKLPLAGVTATEIESVEMFVPGGGAMWLTARDGHLHELKGAGATRATRLKQFWDRLVRSEAAAFPIMEGLGASWAANILSQSDVYGSERRAGVQSCDFTEFLRRLKNWKGDDDQFYSWYVNDYIYHLDPRSIPLSDDEKMFVRSSVEQTRSEIRFPPLSKYLKLIGWKNSSAIRAAYGPYWWSAEGGRQLKLGQSILLPHEAGKLREFVRCGFGRSYPLNYFMLLFALRNGLVNPLAMLFPSGRRRVYEWCYYYAFQNSHVRQHVEGEIEMQLRRQSRALSCRHEDLQFSEENRDLLPQSGETIVLSSGRPDPGSTGQPETRRSYRLQFIGPFDKLLGLGESSRRLMEAVREVEADCNFVCYNDGIQSASIEGNYNYDVRCSDINIIHLNSEQIPEFFLKNGDVVRNSYNIIFPYWELNKVSSLHFLGMSLVDEVWSASTFISSLFEERGFPVVTVGLPASKLRETCGRARDRSDRFTFLTSFDAFSWPQRKNAIAVVEAFIAAFDGVENVRLIIKTQNADYVHSLHQKQAWLDLRRRSSEDDRIEIINETYSPQHQRELLCSCDCFVSLHRSEGLGIDILDALASGIPVVATAYSGNMDVCTDKNSWLVDYDLVPVRKNDYVFVEDGHYWAEPKHCFAVSALRDVYCNDEIRICKSISGMADVEVIRSPGSVSERIFNRLKEVRSIL